jgi:outer membrane protein OmpA-like peptidoglycan-associated protein
LTRFLLGPAALLLACTPALAQAPQTLWVMFAPESIALDESAESQLQRFALDLGARHVVIRGRADPSEVGGAHAADLSQRRATIVHEHLQAYGVSVQRMTVEASDPSAPADESLRDAGHNRRVEVIAYTPTRQLPPR